jgi:hypothetical protein
MFLIFLLRLADISHYTKAFRDLFGSAMVGDTAVLTMHFTALSFGSPQQKSIRYPTLRGAVAADGWIEDGLYHLHRLAFSARRSKKAP